MSTPRHLRNAPITEAILDIRVKARSAVRAEDFSALRTELGGRFPKTEERRRASVVFRIPPIPEPAPMEDLGLQGILFKSDDEKLIAQCRVDGFTLNRLQPYTSWEELFSLAKDLWVLYVGIADPEAVTRLALRYINRIALPPHVDEFGTYMRVPPQIPGDLPQHISAYFYRVSIRDIENDLSAHVTQALEGTSDALTLFLDVDAFRSTDWRPDDPRILETFAALHDFKNQVFFSFLTEQALRSFE